MNVNDDSYSPDADKILNGLDLVDRIMALPMEDRARIVLFYLKERPELANTPWGFKMIRECKKYLKREEPKDYEGTYEAFQKEVEKWERLRNKKE